MRINAMDFCIGWLLGVVTIKCWASDTLPFPKEPPVPITPIAMHLNLNIQEFSQKNHRQVLPKAWVLHIINTYGNPEELVKRLQKVGFDAYMTDKHEIFIGPSASHQELLRVRKQLKKQLRLSSTVEDYQVIWFAQKE